MRFLSPSGYGRLDPEEGDAEFELENLKDNDTNESSSRSRDSFENQLQVPEVSVISSESGCQIFTEMLFPFILGKSKHDIGPTFIIGYKLKPIIYSPLNMSNKHISV